MKFVKSYLFVVCFLNTLLLLLLLFIVIIVIIIVIIINPFTPDSAQSKIILSNFPKLQTQEY